MHVGSSGYCWARFHCLCGRLCNCTLSKRYLMSGYEPLAERSVEYRPAIHLIIPGLTVPALHLPLLVFALIFAQVVHEAGHAVTAAMEKIPLLSVGAAFTIVFPSAFVVLPSTAIEALNPTARLRVISSGAYHNLILWIFLVVFTWSHLSSILLSAIGYTDVSSYGRLVVDIDQESPLRGHIPIGAVITKIDDQSLISHNSDMDIWQLYLSRHTGLPRAEDLGWCVDREWFVAQPESCCTSSRSTNTTGLSCFVASHELPLERCINPIPLLHDTAIAYDIIRCTSLVDCGNTHVCVRLHPDQQLLRLTLHIPSWIRERGSQLVEEVVLWQGPGSEVLEEVVVGAWLPKYGFWPANLPIIADTFFTYLKMLTLSLYFFNMLPLPFLDGAQFLDALFDFFAIREISAQSEQIAMVALEGGTLTPQAPSSNSLRHFDFRRTIRILVAILIGLCVVLGIAQAFS
ncbi:Membrane-bound transcription factor site-2 protease [Grifola frondosa]|uniref:Endopeptidase S2P n=1 Tax=Grifola frondosa TaxID=5627 RepID=A0A1C7MNG0_GRIFR|nr:Membrane-bound transcription factor site-2 protease [Grifola frondosa]